MTRTFVISSLAAVALSGCIGNGSLAEETDEIALVEENLTSSYLACYVDTPAYDLYEPDECLSFGLATKSVADFKIFPSGTPTSIVWAGHSECNGYSRCVVPIRLQSSVTLTVSYVVNGVSVTNTATASYETSR